MKPSGYAWVTSEGVSRGEGTGRRVVGGQGMPGSRLVRMERGEKTQSFNICRSLNTLGDYQDTYVIGHPDPFMSNGEFIR